MSQSKAALLIVGGDEIFSESNKKKEPRQSELHPVGKTQNKKAPRLFGQTPYLVGCLFVFQLYPFIVVKVNIIIDDLLSLLESRVLDPANGFFFEMTKEVFHGSIIPAVAPSGHGGSNVILLGEDMIRL